MTLPARHQVTEALRDEWTWDESADETWAWLVNGERQP